jgi:hypothetical protein
MTRTPEQELEKINEILASYGFQYPTGSAGVADLAFAYALNQDSLHGHDPEHFAPAVWPVPSRPPGMRRSE